MSDHKLHFGDVVEWGIQGSDFFARWMIVQPHKYGYTATWVGDGELRMVGETVTIGWPDHSKVGWEYRLVSDE